MLLKVKNGVFLETRKIHTVAPKIKEKFIIIPSRSTCGAYRSCKTCEVVNTIVTLMKIMCWLITFHVTFLTCIICPK